MTPKVHVPGYTFRIVVPTNDVLFDPHVGNWIEEDGSIPICDVGGQPSQAEFDPDLGHGALWWLRPDDRLEPAVPWGRTHLGMPMFPRIAPASFGRWAGHALILSQVQPGRRGAHMDHVIHIWDRKSQDLVLFATIPRNESAIGNGIPAALIPGGFGPTGSPYEGSYYFTALRNNSIYAVNGRGETTTLAIMDGIRGPALLPRALCFGSDDCFPEHKGRLIVGGIPSGTFIIGDNNVGRKIGQECAFHVVENGKLSDEPIAVGNRMLAFPARATDTFGPLSRKLLFTDHGSINQSQSMYDHTALPHDGAILYEDTDGTLKPLVTQLRSGRNDVLFQGDRLIITHWGKSYSTGEFHLPDGAIWELKYTGN
ncbi:hypothetical protein [Pseudomonas sp. NFX224]|uniref:hypothetical protein n=1 Tax=Pseudomonas sp. NFX224 TaxID=3402862 RepID=UPI003AFB2989